MISFDTNLVIYAASASAPEQPAAAAFLQSLGRRRDVVVCELMLVEVYLKLRNARILSQPLNAARAAAYCTALRANNTWAVVESAPVMESVWAMAGTAEFAIRRIVDARLALTLRHHGVTEFATSNVKDFEGFGFNRVWNPLIPA
jgi:toxin-antitoxin system PIN domain toxin